MNGLVINNLFQLLIMALACASISFSISKAEIFERIRLWTDKLSFIGKLLRCPYCVSHWVAFVFVLLKEEIYFSSNWAGEFIVVSFAIVTLSTIFIGAINKVLDMLI